MVLSNIDKLCARKSPAKAKARARAVMVFALYTHHHHHLRACHRRSSCWFSIKTAPVINLCRDKVFSVTDSSPLQSLHTKIHFNEVFNLARN